MLSSNGITRSAAVRTAVYLIGGVVAAVAIGSGIDRLLTRHSLVIGRGLAALVALATFGVAARLWGRRIAELSGVGDPARAGASAAVYVGIPLIAVAAGLGPLEPAAVRIASGWGLPIHAAYVGLFVPATLIVTAIGTFGLGRGLRDNQLGRLLAARAAPAAAACFLIAAALMYAIGWRIGEPDAARRATMLVVTAVSIIAAALASGAMIGRTLWRMQHGIGTRPARDRDYHLLLFDTAVEAEAFVAAFSRFLSSPMGSSVPADFASLEVWSTIPGEGVTLFLDDGAFRVATEAFTQVPVVDTVRGSEIPHDANLILRGLSARPWGMDEAAARMNLR